MCLFPKLIPNRKYQKNKKNGGKPPFCDDPRKLYVPVGCGVCIECMRQKALQWKIRLYEELKNYPYNYYVTLTFSPQALQDLCNETQLEECNAIAGLALRRYFERWRKKYGKSQRHYFITELGHEGTERIHLHGIVFSMFEIPNGEIEKIWKYGNVRIGDYCNLRTINYIAKYITKIDNDHKQYRPEIFCSAGIGKSYTKKISSRNIHLYRGKDTNDFYRFPNGQKCALPIYFRNQLFTEEQREELWCHKLDQKRRFVNGVEITKIDTLEGERRYFRVLKKAQEKNAQLGYGDCTKQWQKKKYNVTQRMLQKGKKGNGCDKI